MRLTAPANTTKSGQLVDDHIRRTRRSLKIVDLLSGIITLTIGLLLYLLMAALLEHWLIPGGWSTTARTILLLVMLAGMTWYGWLAFWPLIRQSINPLYAAKTIEQASPSLKNSLLNLLMFRAHGRHSNAPQRLPQPVYQAIEQQAAMRLAQVQTDTAVDHSAVLRLGYTLVAVMAVFALYRLLSPKDPIASAGRVLMPWSMIAAPSRVQILNIEPGDIAVARGEPLTIQANILGLQEEEPVILRYSTSDGQHAQQSIAMWLTAEDGQPNIRYQCQLPDSRSTDLTAAGSLSHAMPGSRLSTTHQGHQRTGIQQDLQYWIEAGDSRSARYQIKMIDRPTMVVERIRYIYPDYTGFPPREVVASGDIRALEGTQVIISALANYPILRAHLDFEADGRHDVAMRVVQSRETPQEDHKDGVAADSDPATPADRATVTFPLKLRDDRRTPRHSSYVLRFTTSSNQSNLGPPKYQIDVTPDYAPEITLATTTPELPPEGKVLDVRLDQTISVTLEASDPDFALADVRVVGQLQEALEQEQGREKGQQHAARPLEQVLLSGRHTGRYTGSTNFTPRELGLKAGAILHYWAAASDNRTPEPNVTLTPRQTVRVIGSTPENLDGSGQDPTPENPRDRQADKGEAPGESSADGSETGEEGNNRPDSASSEQGDQSKQDDQDGTGPGGLTGGSDDDSTSGDSQGDGSNSGNTDPGDSQPSEDQENRSDGNSGGASDSTEDAGQQSPDDSASGEPGANEMSEQQPGTSPPGEPTGDQATEGSNHPSAQSRSHQGESNGAQQDKVSPEGDDDGTAFDRMSEYLARQEANRQDDQETESSRERQQDSGDLSQAERATKGEPTDQESAAPDGRGQDSPDQTPSNPGDRQRQESQAANNTSETAKDDRTNDDHRSDQSSGPQSPESQPSKAAPESGEPTPDQGSTGEKSQPPSESKDRDQSDSNGQQGGDRSGAGEKGAGQQDQTEGSGSAGQHQPSDQGSGQAADQGAGETSSNSGNDQSTSGQTGQPSDNQPGSAGEKQGPLGDQPEDGQKNSASPDQRNSADSDQPETASGANQTGKDGQRTEDRPPGQTDPKDQAESNDQTDSQPTNQSGKQAQGQASDSSQGPPSTSSQQADGNDGQPPEAESGNNNSPQQGNTNQQPLGGGGAGNQGSPPEAETGEPGGDEANLDYARMQTDLVLNRLSDQLEKQQVDEQMLDMLGWNREDLRRFVDRWNGLKSNATGQDDKAQAAQQELNAALRSLGLSKKNRIRYRSQVSQDQLRDLQDAYQDRTPADLIERVRDYIKGTATGEGEKEK
jgi:collagen type III alpha